MAALSSRQAYAQAPCPAPVSCTPGDAPAANRVYRMGLHRVQLANLVDTTAASSDAGYRDYGCRPGAQLVRGTTYTLQVTTNANADETVRAWLDLNGDGAFAANELVLASTGRQHRASFALPAAAPVGGALRLRIAADYANAPVPGPCTTPQYSQTADYRVVVVGGAPPAPRAAFAAVDSVGCSGTVAFRDHSANAPTAWRWAFGDGTASAEANPVHTYAAPGTYTVRLRVCNANGCDSLAKPAYVTVRGNGPRPASCQPATRAYCCDFGLLRAVGVGLDHRPGGGATGYQDASCANRAALMADWPDTLRLTTGGQAAHDVRVYADLNNDGNFDPATELLYEGLGVRNPAVPLRIGSLAPGLVYDRALRLRIWADYAGSPAVGPCAPPEKGQVVDYAVLVQPNTRPPRAAFTLAYEQVCGPVRVGFVNTSQGSAAARWDFGDGSTSADPAPPAHTYGQPGVYTVRLVAMNGARSDTARQQVAVAAACPSYCTAGGWGGNEDSPLHFSRVTVADMDNPTFRGPRVGYRDFTRYVATVRQGQRVVVQAESLPFTSGGNGPWVVTTGWADFNQDGEFGPSEQLPQGTGLSPQQVLLRVPHGAQLGAVRLRLFMSLVVVNDLVYTNGCPPAGSLSATEDYTLMVLPELAAPRSGFTADLAASCSGQVQFRDTTWAAPTAWRWDFGDGTTSAEASPLHTYPGPGRYSVSLETRNAYGTSAVTRQDYVTVTGTGQGPRPAAVALSSGPLYDTYGIAEAQLATLAYTGGEYQPGYRDESCRAPALRLAAGGTYPLSVMRTNRFAYHHVYLWLDANDNGVFDPQERIEALRTATIDAPQLGTFTIPPTAVRNRPLRLRLYWHSMRANDYPAGSPAPDPQTRDEEYDQVRDFTVWVEGAVLATAPQAAAGTWSMNPNPTAGVVTLSGVDASHGVQLINSVGQLLGPFAAVPEPGNGYRMDLRMLPKGLYMVRLPGITGTKRLVIE